ncbi:MAG TPA: hypothetical protein DCL15_09405 [Chloroflexi bacterium]|nr:hypothetical protein [Chloroflexota bacterium]
MHPCVNDLKRNLWSRLLNLLLIVGLALPATPAMAAPVAQQQPGAQSAVLRDCSAINETTLQDELNAVTQQIFADQIATLDLNAIIARAWVAQEMDQALDAAVTQAVARVQSETELWDKFLSAWSPDLARELTLAVATYTFDAPTLRAQMETLATAISGEIAAELTMASADSASAALYCMQTFIDTNYSAALVRAFESRVAAATSSAQLVNAEVASPDILTLVGEHQLALGGVGVIIAAQITRKIMTSVAQRISQRVAGRIVGRVLGRVGTTVVPLAGWLIGAGMIAYDLYTSRDGALPQIEASLKSAAVKAGVREEIAASIRPELSSETPALARSVANDLFAEWRTVKRTLQQVLELAAEDPDFAALLATLHTQEELTKLVQLVGIVQEAGGRAALDAAVADDTLRQVLALPDVAITLVRDSGSLQTALDWHAVVGSRLGQVVALELHKHLAPSQIDLTQLDALLALDDKTAVARLALLPPAALGPLLQLADANLSALANLLTPDELTWLAAQLPALAPAQRNQLVARLLSQPEAIATLQRLGESDALSSAADVDATITFLTGRQSGLDYLADAGAVLTGAVTPPLFWAKYGLWPTVGGGVGLLAFVLVALRIVWGVLGWLFQPLSVLRRRKS